MRQVLVTACAAAALSIHCGCAWIAGYGKTGEASESARERVSRITASGGLAVHGAGEAGAISAAVDRARAQARKEAVRAVKARLKALQKSFLDETGEGMTPECEDMFESAVRSLLDGLPEVAPAGVEFTTRDGTTTAHVVMEISPAAIVSALETAGQGHRALHARLAASKTFTSLAEDARKYGELKRQRAI